MRVAPLLVPVAALALLAACTGDPEEREPTPDRAEAGAQRVKVATGDDGSDDGSDDVVTADPGDLAACILGDWSVDMTAQAAVAQSTLDMVTPGSHVSAAGRSDLHVDATQLVSTLTDAATSVTLTIEGQELLAVTTMNGVTVQSYTLDGDLMTTYGVDTSGLSVDTRTYLDGVETVLPGFDEGFQNGQDLSATTVGTARLVCTADRLQQIPVVDGTEVPELATVLTRG